MAQKRRKGKRRRYRGKSDQDFQREAGNRIWEFLKYEIRKRSIAFSKALAKNLKNNLLSKITKFEQDIDSKEKFVKYTFFL